MQHHPQLKSGATKPWSWLTGRAPGALAPPQESLLVAAREALEQVRQRDPADSRLRLHGANIAATTTDAASSTDRPNGAAPTSSSAASRGLTAFVWESDLDGQDDGSDSFVFGGSRDYMPPPAAAANAGGEWGSSGGGGQSWSQSGLDSWFGDKVDVGPVALRQTMKPVQAAQVAVLERPSGPSSLEFQAPEAPESAGPSLFPETVQLHFQPREAEVAAAAEAEVAVPAEAEPEAAPPKGDWERRSGEEIGPHGYWYRWTEVRGCDKTGAVQWYEKWWEVSDWRGMKEMGAEKWGCNAQGDAWRETWREAIVAGHMNAQPLVERSAHKWAKSGEGNEWEEKWGEKYWSAGGAEKWADKWGREGGDVWHEKWGETYDGAGGCVKWTDKWAERLYPDGAKEEWGDKWEENFKDGRGTKQGETWSISGGGERYNRWWGENHIGDGLVQKFGNSNTGEHWDVTEQMDTYYNPIPHFGYNLALEHSPQLRNVPMLPRDRVSLEGGMQAVA
ncbi:hypothetical protein ABPG77_009967 [Micractinium sp. CCAP 211/92]